MTNHPGSGIVLAAGRSRRMGASKALLRVGDRTFLRAAIETLREGGCGTVLAAVAASDVAVEARRAGAVVVEGSPEGEQVDSLRLALGTLERAAGSAGSPGSADVADRPEIAVVLPVDHPLVSSSTVRALLAAAATRPDAIIRPVHDGRPGHPTLFPRSVWPALRDPELPRGARSVVESPDAHTVDVEVDDPGVVADIDTPEAYRRYVGGGAR